MNNKASLDKYGIALIIRGTFGAVITTVFMFVSAGTVRWLEGWIFAGLWCFSLVFTNIILAIKDPELCNMRGKRPGGTKSWDKIILFVYTILSVISMIIPGLDVIRFHWSALPQFFTYPGIVLFIAGYSLSLAAILTNHYFEATVRIQKDRQQQVCSRGPYSIIRHPGYAAALVFTLSMPLILRSAWAFIPTIGMIILFVIRTALEDKTLIAELPGYAEYTGRVKFRIIPGLW